MPFQKGNKPPNPQKKGEKGRNPYGCKGKYGEVRDFVADVLSLSDKAFDKQAVKQQCKDIEKLVKDLPTLKQLRAFHHFRIANRCGDMLEMLLKQFEDKLKGKEPISPRDLSAIASSISAISKDSNKVIDEYIRSELERQDRLTKPNPDENMVDASQPTIQDLPMIHAD